jgi:hypothetical protein
MMNPMISAARAARRRRDKVRREAYQALLREAGSCQKRCGAEARAGHATCFACARKLAAAARAKYWMTKEVRDGNC